MMIKRQLYLNVCWICIWRQIFTSYVFTCRNRNYVCLWNIFSFSNFLLIACDSVILDSLKHVFYIVLHMNLTLSLFLSHSFLLSVFFISFSLCFESPSLSSISPFLDYYNMTVYLRLRNPTEISLLTSTRTYRKGWNDDVCAF